MRGIKELNEKVDEILNDPKNYNKTIRIWRQRAKTGKLSLQKKIEIVETFGANEISIKLVPTQSIPLYTQIGLDITKCGEIFRRNDNEDDNN